MAITTIKSINIEPTLLSKINNSISDAPTDGKQYARKDGDWEEVGGSFLGDVTKSVGTGGDFADLDELQTWMNANSGRFLTVNVLGEVASPSGALPILTNQSFLQLTLNGVSGSALNMTYFFGNIGLSGQFTVKGDLTFSSYVPNMFILSVTLSKTSNETVNIYNSGAGGTDITYDGILRVYNSRIARLCGESLSLENTIVTLIDVFDDGASPCVLYGNNTIGTLDANNKIISVLLSTSTGATTISSINNDSNVTHILSGKTINTFNNWGYVTVANK